ncbi:HAD hydrolase family protein [Enterococcus cecorum]
MKLCLASGRAPIQIPHFDGVDFDAFLTFNGSYCYTKDCDIHSNPLSKEDVHTVIKNSAKSRLIDCD